MPQNSVYPVVMAADTIMHLLTIVSLEIVCTDVIVLTVGSFYAGDAANVVLRLGRVAADPAQLRR